MISNKKVFGRDTAYITVREMRGRFYWTFRALSATDPLGGPRGMATGVADDESMTWAEAKAAALRWAEGHPPLREYPTVDHSGPLVGSPDFRRARDAFAAALLWEQAHAADDIRDFCKEASPC